MHRQHNTLYLLAVKAHLVIVVVVGVVDFDFVSVWKHALGPISSMAFPF